MTDPTQDALREILAEELRTHVNDLHADRLLTVGPEWDPVMVAALAAMSRVSAPVVTEEMVEARIKVLEGALELIRDESREEWSRQIARTALQTKVVPTIPAQRASAPMEEMDKRAYKGRWCEHCRCEVMGAQVGPTGNHTRCGKSPELIPLVVWPLRDFGTAPVPARASVDEALLNCRSVFESFLSHAYRLDNNDAVTKMMESAIITINRARAAPQSAAAGQEPDGWRSMDSAPKDGTSFIGAFQYDGETDWQIHEFEWDDSRGLFVRPYDELPDEEDQPSRWQPLPKPPHPQEPNTQGEKT